MTGFLIRTLNPGLIRNHTRIILLIWVLFALFSATYILFTIFLWTGSFTLIDLKLSWEKALIADTLLSIIFFLQHSIMVRKGFKQRLGKLLPEFYHGAFYALTSALTLLPVMLFWQRSSTIIISADGLVYWFLRALFFLCLAGFAWGTKSLGSFDALGVKPLMRHLSNRPSRPQQIMAKGPYRWVRHPLYLFMIILIWSCPVLTTDRLVFNILWTVWIVIGTCLEDRDLHREFGNQYRQYSAKVPMLIPYRIPGHHAV